MARMRRKMSRRASKKNFRRGAKQNGKNRIVALRGGYRL